MSEEIVEDMLEEVAPQVAGDYPEIAQRYKAGEELTDEELDTIADVAISILRSFRTSMPPTLLSMSMRATRVS